MQPTVLHARLEGLGTAPPQKSGDSHKTHAPRQTWRLRIAVLSLPGGAVARRVIDLMTPSGPVRRRPPAVRSPGGLQGAPLREGRGAQVPETGRQGPWRGLPSAASRHPSGSGVAPPGPPPRRLHRRRHRVRASAPYRRRHEAAGPAAEADLAAGDARRGADAGAAARAPQPGPAAVVGLQVGSCGGGARRARERRAAGRRGRAPAPGCHVRPGDSGALRVGDCDARRPGAALALQLAGSRPAEDMARRPEGPVSLQGEPSLSFLQQKKPGTGCGADLSRPLKCEVRSEGLGVG